MASPRKLITIGLIITLLSAGVLVSAVVTKQLDAASYQRMRDNKEKRLADELDRVKMDGRGLGTVIDFSAPRGLVASDILGAFQWPSAALLVVGLAILARGWKRRQPKGKPKKIKA